MYVPRREINVASFFLRLALGKIVRLDTQPKYYFDVVYFLTLLLHCRLIADRHIASSISAAPYTKIPFKYHWIVLASIMAKGIWMVSEWYLNDISDSL